MTYGGTIQSKSGKIIPVFKSGKPSASKYDPEKEAESFASSIEEASFFVIPGLCGGYHVAAIRKKYPNSKIMVVENSEKDIKFLKENVDFCKALFSDKMVLICDIEKARECLLQNYIPALQKNFSLIEYRPWLDENKEKSAKLRDTIKSALKEISIDFSTQCRFGKIWQHNILKNLKAAESEVFFDIDNTKTAAVIAAGPSLEKKMDFLKRNKKNLYIISTDTAYPSLKKNGVFCDAVFSLDGQFVSHTHFLSGFEKNTLFVFDLQANPSAVRNALHNGNNVVFAKSGHPLSSYAENTQEKKCFIDIESGAGTVTICALDFAIKSGFKDILIFGADFSYSNGKSYAKGTYLEKNFLFPSNRTKTYEENFVKLLFRSALIKLSKNTATTELLDSYKSSFISYMKKSALDFSYEDFVYHIHGKGNPESEKAAFNYNSFSSFIKKDIEILEKKGIGTEELFDFPLVKAVLPYISHIEFSMNIPFDKAMKLAFEDVTRYT